ncbi:MAG TPA: signal recognition particle-docking protein FtsY [Lactobacillus sp.]|nr:signal recognition particle-docking protein FtsY [Lactobacillus sp.]
MTARQSVANSLAAARQAAHRLASQSAAAEQAASTAAVEKAASQAQSIETARQLSLAQQAEQESAQSVQVGSADLKSTDSVERQTSSERVTSGASISGSEIDSEKGSAVDSIVTSGQPGTENTNPASESDTRTDAELYDQGLAKSRQTLGERFNAFLANFRSVDEDFFDDLEETLIGADVGFNTAVQITDELRDEVKLKNAKKQQDVENVIVEKLVNLYDQAGASENTAINMAKSGPTVIFFVGVNGVGKTTTVGKMANMYKKQGKKVLLAAADTFRAGAIEQLQVWGKRDGVPVVALPERSDPAAVVFDAVQRAKQENFDILMVDTAGRLQNKVNLMNELSKMKRVLTREIPEAPHEVLLVLDATTGQNALNQAKTFGEITAVTGIVLTKLDGTAKGGIVLAIRNEMHLPVKFVGLGEQVNDLRPFDANEFVYGLFKGLIKE